MFPMYTRMVYNAFENSLLSIIKYDELKQILRSERSVLLVETNFPRIFQIGNAISISKRIPIDSSISNTMINIYKSYLLSALIYS